MIRIIQMRGPLFGLQSSSYSQILKEEAKKTPGLTWDPSSRSWIGYSDGIALAAKRARARGLIIQGGIPAPAPSGLLAASAGLRDYQKVGVEFLLTKMSEGCILADEVSLGKSAQAATAARALRQKCLIVCPSFGRGVWLDLKDGELVKWWPAAKVVALSGTKPGPIDPDADVVVCHYDILYAHVEALIAWGAKTLIVDEIHYCMGGKSRRTQAVAKLASVCTHRAGLSGTPITSKPLDLWAPVNTISEGRFGKLFNYAMAFCNAHQEQVTPTKTVWKFDGASNLNELNERLNFSPTTPWGFMLRRLKSEVAIELPARTRQVLTLDVTRGHIMAPLAAMKSDKILRKALDMAADGKFPQVIDIAIGHLEQGLKVVVGTHRRAIADLIAEGVRQRGPWKVEVVTGEVPLAKRQAIIKSQPDLLCATLDSTAAAINLSYASVGIVAELVWVPSTLVQWEGRFGREPGKNVLIVYPIARATIEEVIRAQLINKIDRFTAAVGKVDNKLREDFKGLEGPAGAAARMVALYERMMKANDD